jgi:hypothetical protein
MYTHTVVEDTNMLVKVLQYPAMPHLVLKWEVLLLERQEEQE